MENGSARLFYTDTLAVGNPSNVEDQMTFDRSTDDWACWVGGARFYRDALGDSFSPFFELIPFAEDFWSIIFGINRNRISGDLVEAQIVCMHRSLNVDSSAAETP